MRKLIFTLFASVLCALNLNAQSITPGTGNILYVNAAVTGGNGSGGSWTNAIPSLANALHYARVNAANWSADSLRIFVAKGTYYPSYRADNGSLAVNNRDAAFVMVNNVQIYGGFDPDNSINDLTDTRIFDNTGSILSGDIGDVGNSNDNAYHVVISAGDVGNALIDGFSIVKGNANGSVDISVNGKGIYQLHGGGMYNCSSSPTITNIIISGNTANVSGGGMFNYSSSPTITNTTISGNTADTGGGMNNDGSSSPTITNTIISGNTANFSGGGMYNYSSSPSITNTTISGNKADTGGGTVNSTSSSPNITNTTISGNTANAGGGMYNYSSTPILYNSILLGNKTGIYGDAINASSAHNLIQTGNEASGGALDGTPLNHSTPSNIFVQPITPGLSTAGDFSLQFRSPAIDAGDNALYTNAGGELANDMDLARNARVFDYANGGVIDLGAYEFQTALTTPSTANILYVDSAVSGGNGSGDSWTNAIASLADAVHYARVNAANWSADSLRIFVAKGTYYPSYRADDSSLAVNNRNAAFVMVKNVQIYGGFDPANSIDDLTDTRIFDNTGSILSGDIGDVGNSNDNAYHVVISVGDVGNALIDGFSIVKGNADGSGNITVNGETVDQGYGGGMANYNHSSPVITNATISGNTASFGGGGMFNSSNSSPVITNVTLIGNTSTNNGGGMFNYNNSSPVITNATISGNSATFYGGGLYNFSYSSPKITNTTINDNVAFTGGGFFNASSSPTITNTKISGNTATYGGGMYNYNSSSAMITNATISGNTATYDGGGMYNSSSSPMVTNATISGNKATTNGGGMYNANSSTPALYNSILLGNNTGIVGDAIHTGSAHNLIQTGNETSGGALDGTPLNHSTPSNIFVQPITPGLSNAGDFSLQFGSAAADAGDNALYTNAGGNLANDVDLAGNTRVFDYANGGVLDLGAYEFQAALTTPSSANILYVDAAVSGGNGSGDSWTNAIPSLANALHYARVNAANWTADSLRIFVAKGTYYPSYRADDSRLAMNDRDAAFVMVKNVQIYGGFDPPNGIDHITDTRIFDNTGSILSGDIGNVGNSNDNAYHVVIAADAIGNARIDGFSIVKGNADGTGNITVNGQPLNQNNGGGIINYSSSSPLITNATISGNSANYGGGIFNYSSSPVITNATISGNTVANNGGGVYNNKSSPAITNVTISGNTATNGGGMYNVNSSTPTLYNSIILGNNTGIVGNAINTSSAHNLIQTGDETSGGAIDGTPLNNSTPSNIFVQSITPGLSTAGDFSLKSNSAAVDAGDNALYSGDLANDNDLAGNTRVYNYANGGVIDLGAYEFQGDVLPVTLIDFIGALRKGVAQLQWSTGVESHLKHFEIQKSLNGLSFKILGTISAKGSNNTYSYSAPQLEATAYYRLKMVDDDGNIQFSTTLTLSQSGTSDILVYPNPAKDYIHIKMENAGSIRIYNASGALVKTQTVQSGLNMIHISQLSTGMYYLLLDGKKVKFIKL